MTGNYDLTGISRGLGEQYVAERARKRPQPKHIQWTPRNIALAVTALLGISAGGGALGIYGTNRQAEQLALERASWAMQMPYTAKPGDNVRKICSSEGLSGMLLDACAVETRRINSLSSDEIQPGTDIKALDLDDNGKIGR